jgi:hypothetical protein
MLSVRPAKAENSRGFRMVANDNIEEYQGTPGTPAADLNPQLPRAPICFGDVLLFLL